MLKMIYDYDLCLQGYQLALEQRKQLATKEWIIFREVKEGNPEEVFVSVFISTLIDNYIIFLKNRIEEPHTRNKFQSNFLVQNGRHGLIREKQRRNACNDGQRYTF